jgi:HSP20 family molecular chaperone IbpA
MHVLVGPKSSKHSAQISFDRTLPEIEPFGRRDLGFSITPAIEIAEKEKAFEVTAELPSLDGKNIDLQLSAAS